MTLAQRPAGGKTRFELERERLLAPEIKKSNRAQPAGLPASYTIAPRSTFDASRGAAESGPWGRRAWRRSGR
jgi:transcription factor SPN1